MTDFPVAEYEGRMERLRAQMTASGLDAILLCTEAEVRYFSGFRSLFWQSPTRPWFLILPRASAPVAVIPGIGAELMGTTWVKDIRTWASPDPTDDGVGLLIDALSGYDRIGLPMGEEASLRWAMNDFNRVAAAIGGAFEDCSALIKAVRLVKSSAEIDVIREICGIASASFDRAAGLFSAGQPLNEAFRAFKIALLQAGAEDVPYLVGGAGQGGYGDVISPPDTKPLQDGDVLMLDTGSTLKGYFCDFDRNFGIGQVEEAAKAGYRKLWEATEAGLGVARAGTTCAQLFDVMHNVLGGGSSDVGRYGHGLGIQLTEYPSIVGHDHTALKAGMVMTLEPSMTMSNGKMMVHEENILITEDAPVLLTTRAAPELPEI